MKKVGWFIEEVVWQLVFSLENGSFAIFTSLAAIAISLVVLLR